MTDMTLPRVAAPPEARHRPVPADTDACAPGLARPQAARIAYFTNVYPKTSHSFIRNEIAALERQGLAVMRLTVRRATEPLVDPHDRAEDARTDALLGGPRLRLLGPVAAWALRTPRGWLRALRLALAEGWRSPGVARSLAYFIEACGLAERMRAQSIRHVHVHFGTNPATVARLAAALSGVSYSLTVHGPDEFDAPRALRLGEKLADARFAVAISDHGRGQLMRWSAPVDWPRISVVRCGVAPAFLDAAPEGGGGTSFLCVARLSAQKGLGVLLGAVEQVARAHCFTLDIIGDGEMRPWLEAEIARRGLAPHVRLLGLRSADEVRHALAAARVFVLPSLAEGLPVVLMEALAMRRPVIATAIAGIPELVDASCGWLVPSGSDAALARAMAEALDTDDATLRTMGEAGRARVARLHDVDANAAALAALLASCA